MIKYDFQSKLEKRWYSIFQKIGLKCEYEEYSFEITIRLKKFKYIPDFYFPEQDLYVEVKAPHQWEGRGMEKARAFARTGKKILKCTNTGKFFFIRNTNTDAYLFKCLNCNKYYFLDETINPICYFCNSTQIMLISSGKEGIVYWWNNNENKWLFNNEQYEQNFNTVHPKHQDQIKNLYERLHGIPVESEYSEKKILQLDQLFKKYPNMQEVKEYFYSIITTLELRTKRTIVFQPLLLIGSPGCGKTSFATELSQILTERCPIKIEFGNGVANFTLSGSDRGFDSSEPGRILQSLFSDGLSGPLKNPVIILDEFDKIDRYKYNPETVFYTLMEKKSAEIFTDNYFQIAVDASHINYIALANSTQGIAKPILDRFKIMYIRDYTETEFLQEVITHRYEEWLKTENIIRERVPKHLSPIICKEIMNMADKLPRKIPASLNILLKKYQTRDKHTGEMISLFTKAELSHWHILAGETPELDEIKTEKQEQEYSLLDDVMIEIEAANKDNNTDFFYDL